MLDRKANQQIEEIRRVREDVQALRKENQQLALAMAGDEGFPSLFVLLPRVTHSTLY